MELLISVSLPSKCVAVRFRTIDNQNDQINKDFNNF